MAHFVRIVIVLSIGMLTGSTALAAEKISYDGNQIRCDLNPVKQLAADAAQANKKKSGQQVGEVE